jgi:DNA repair exonuclease SbcCD ATPase subunit
VLFRSIFVISHQNEFGDFFDNVLTVRKKEGVSYLEQE